MFWEQSRVEKNDRNFPLRRQPSRITSHNEQRLTHKSSDNFEERRPRLALPVRDDPDGNRLPLTNSFRNGDARRRSERAIRELRR